MFSPCTHQSVAKRWLNKVSRLQRLNITFITAPKPEVMNIIANGKSISQSKRKLKGVLREGITGDNDSNRSVSFLRITCCEFLPSPPLPKNVFAFSHGCITRKVTQTTFNKSSLLYGDSTEESVSVRLIMQLSISKGKRIQYCPIRARQ